jgi:hypothetical protein
MLADGDGPGLLPAFRLYRYGIDKAVNFIGTKADSTTDTSMAQSAIAHQVGECPAANAQAFADFGRGK